MFSGIVERTGKVLSFDKNRIKIYAGKNFKVKRGESVSVNGACLTVISSRQGVLVFDLSPETLKRTNLSSVHPGDFVNLERSLKLGMGVSGHIVQGHVLTSILIKRIERIGEFAKFEFEIKEEIEKYIIEKGFVAIDGISLTVSEIKAKTFAVDIIPETMRVTNLKYKKVGDKVNFEPDFFVKTIADILPRYLEKLKILPTSKMKTQSGG
jgi:riboflavin synthase